VIRFADTEKEIICGYKDSKEKESWMIEIRGCFERARRSSQGKSVTPTGQGPHFQDLIQAMTSRTRAATQSYETNGTPLQYLPSSSISSFALAPLPPPSSSTSSLPHSSSFSSSFNPLSTSPFITPPPLPITKRPNTALTRPRSYSRY